MGKIQGEHEKTREFLREGMSEIKEILKDGGHMPSEAKADLLKSYCSWVHNTTTSFTIAGLNVSLPIMSVWVRLRVGEENEKRDVSDKKSIEQILSEYHEWERLADQSGHEGAKDAEYVAAFNSRVVVVGGPGSGKSTLLKRLTHKYSSLGKTVLRVRLPLVVQRMKKRGDKFEDALINVAGDGSGVSLNDLRILLAYPHYLLADGLDECEPYSAEIADSLRRWSSGHEPTTIIVTTRPVIYNPGMLMGWKHFELLPLSKSDAEVYADLILSRYFRSDAEKVQSELSIFKDHIRTSKVASLAARNPLLLGFIICLSLNRVCP
jgi:predicted NACHT family NTPase